MPGKCGRIWNLYKCIRSTYIGGIHNHSDYPAVFGPLNLDTPKIIEREIQNYINENNSPYSPDVSLPEKITFGTVQFSFITGKTTLIFIPFGLFISILIYFLLVTDFEKSIKNRLIQLTSDYPEIVSKLLLLHGAGLTVHNSFAVILANSKKETCSGHYIYLEIERTLNKLKSGSSEMGAYAELGQRCHLHSYIKLGTLLEQNIRKGSSDLRDALNQEVHEAFIMHKANVLQAGEKAGTKMLIPMILIFIVVMIIVAAPAFLSMNT